MSSDRAGLTCASIDGWVSDLSASAANVIPESIVHKMKDKT